MAEKFHPLVDISSLPTSVQDIAEVLGLTILEKLVAHFAGVELRIPHKLTPNHKLMVLGEEHAIALCEFCPNDTILVPISMAKKDMQGEVKRLEGLGLKRWEIAKTLGITQRYVRKLANSERKPKTQLDLFAE